MLYSRYRMHFDLNMVLPCIVGAEARRSYEDKSVCAVRVLRLAPECH